MPIDNKIYSFIHSATTANLTAFTYSQVYASIAASPTINGIIVPLAAGTSLDININSVGGALTGVFLLGEKASVGMGGTSTGGAESIIGGSYAG